MDSEGMFGGEADPDLGPLGSQLLEPVRFSNENEIQFAPGKESETLS